jgi:ABC-2 type transport system permease protein
MNDLINSTRAELLRLRRWPAVKVILACWLTLALLFGYVFNYVSYLTGDNSFSNDGASTDTLLAEVLPANAPAVLLQGMPMFGGALMLTLGAIAAASGYGWGTWKTIYLQRASRSTVNIGSMLALVVMVAVTVLITLVFCFAVSSGIAMVEGQSITWPSVAATAEATGAGFLVLLMWTMAGYLLGTLTRSPALAVGFGLVWSLVLENLLRGVGALLSGVEKVTEVFPGTAAGSLVGSVLDASGGGDGTPGVLTVLSGGTATVALVCYLVALPALTLVLVRRDVA